MSITIVRYPVAGGGFRTVYVSNGASDTFIGTSANEEFQGNGGNDYFDGAGGTDTAHFKGKLSDYTLTWSGNHLTVTHKNGGSDGSDTLVNVEWINFGGTLYQVKRPDPVVGGAGTLSYTEGAGAKTVSGTLTVADADSANLTGATVRIASGFQAGDQLSFTNGGGITGVWNAASQTLTLTGTASVAAYQAALRSITFLSTSDTPTATKTVQWTVTDGSYTSAPVTTTINVTAVNDAPVATIVPASFNAVEGQSLSLKNAGLSVGDPDAATSQVSVTLAVAQGTLTVSAGSSGASVSGSGTGSVTITGTVAQVNALLNGDATSVVSYTNNLDVPAANVALTLAVNDLGNSGTGGAKTGNDSATVFVTAVNDAPTIAAPAALAVVEDVATALTGITFADPDAGNGTVTVTLSVGSGTLAATSGGGVTVGGNAGARTLTGSISAINAFIASGQVSFATAQDSTAPVALAISIDDGGNTGVDPGLSGSATSEAATRNVTLNVTPVNDAPVAGADTIADVAEDSGVTTILASTLLGNDSAGPNEAGQSLSITGVSNVVGGSAEVVNGNVAFTPTANYNGPASFTYTVTDNGTTNGAADPKSATATASFNVTPVNDAPVANDDPVTANDDAYTITEDAAVTAFVVLGNDVEDPDAGAANTVTPGSVTVTETAGAFNLGATDVTVGVDGDRKITVELGASFQKLKHGESATIAVPYTLTGNGAGDADTATLTVTVTGANDAPTANNDAAAMAENGVQFFDVLANDTDVDFGDTQTIVAGSIASVEVKDANGNVVQRQVAVTIENNQVKVDPGTAFDHLGTGEHETITFSYTMQDASGVQRTAQVTLTVNGAPENQPPTVTAGGTLAYTENDPATAIDTSVAVSDSDPFDANLEGATVQITGNYVEGEDLLSLDPDPQNGISASFDAASGTLTLTGTASQAHYAAALESVKYRNTSDNPTVTQRTVTYKVSDGIAESAGSTATITVSATNDPPGVSASGAAPSYTEDGPAVAVDSGFTVSDADTPTLQSARLVLGAATYQAGDTLNFSNSFGITSSGFDPATRTLTLVGTASLADWASALQSVTFSTTSQAPGTSRTVHVTVNDGSADSATIDKTFTVVPLDDEPTLTATGASAGSPATFTETSLPDFAGTGPVDLFSNVDVSTVEPGQGLDRLVLTVSNVADTTEFLMLNGTAVELLHGNSASIVVASGVNATVNVSVTSGTATVTVAPAVALSEAQMEALVDSIGYNNTSDTPTAGNRTITLTSLRDTGGGTAPDDNTASLNVSSTVNVVPTNDAPVAADVSFSGTIFNTGFVVNDDSDGAPSTTGPAKTVTVSTPVQGNILAGASDVDTAASSLSVTPGTLVSSTPNGGTLTIEADGDFVYNPGAGFSGNAVFTYTLNDNDSLGNKTDTGTITIAVPATPKVWYVDPNAATNGDGTSDNPFNSLTALNGVTGDGTTNDDVDGAGDIIFVYGGTLNGNLVLEEGQQLIGKSRGLTISGTQLETASGPNTLINGSVMLGLNSSIDGIDLGSTTGWALSGVNVGNATFANGSINNTTGGAVSINGSGTGMNLQFTSVSSANSSGNALAFINARGTFNAASGTLSNATNEVVNFSGNDVEDDLNFTYGGTISDDTGRLVSIVNQTGGTITFNGAITDGNDGDGTGIFLNSNVGGTVNFNGQTTLSTGTAAALTATNNTGMTVNFTGGLDIATTTGVALTATNGGTLNISGAGNSITATQGQAVNLTSVSGNVTFETISASVIANVASAGHGILLSNFDNSSFTVTGTTTLNDFNNEALRIVNSDSTTFTFGGRVTSINDLDSDMDGAIEGNGISLSTNTGSTTSFNGGVTVVTSAGSGFLASAAGTVTVGGSGNTIASTNATALSVQNTTIGSAGLTFQSISSTGGSGTGIYLDNAGSGGLTVTGVGTTAGSGGTIANKTGTDGVMTTGVGVYVNNTSNVSLSNMQLNDFGNYAIRGNNVSGFTLANSTINGANGNNPSLDEASLSFDNLTGTASISSTSISGGLENNFRLVNSSGNLNLTFTAVTIGANSTSDGNDGIGIEATGAANLTATIQNSTFTSARGDLFQISGNGTGTTNLTFTGNTLTNNHPAIATGGGGVSLFNGGDRNSTFTVTGNTFRDAVGHAVLVVNGTDGIGNAGVIASQDGDLTLAFNNNTIGVVGIANSGSREGAGIKIQHAGGSAGSTLDADIINNNIHQYNNEGILIQAGAGLAAGGMIVAEVADNLVSNPGNNAAISNVFQGFAVNSGVTPGDNFVTYLTLGGDGSQENIFTGSGRNGGVDMRIRARQNTDIHLTANDATGNVPVGATYHYTGGTTDAAAVATFLAQHNQGSQAHAALDTGEFRGDSPPAPFSLLASGGGVAASGSDDDTTLLRQEDLTAVTNAAIARWAAAGLGEADLATLRGLTFSVSDLVGSSLGVSWRTHITIDADAAGYGWFVDPTPGDDTEFGVASSATRLLTTPEGAPAGDMDLLTAVVHEMGHILGLDDSYSSSDTNSVMYGYLATGERRLPSAADLQSSAPAPEAPPPPMNLVGTALKNTLVGAAGNDTFQGKGGRDFIEGGSGTDTAIYSGVSRNYVWSQNVDGTWTVRDKRWFNSDGIDTLRNVEILKFADKSVTIGTAPATVISGNGAEFLFGGPGADAFVFDALADSLPGAKDTIQGFVAGLDKIDLLGIDANVGKAGDQAFSFIGASAFTGVAGQLAFANGVLSGDVNGDKFADFQVVLAGVRGLTHTDFLL